MSDFSHHQRETILTKLKVQPYDVLIIGGGITGAGIALDAASRGLRTALVEKNDFAFGTSSRSTKLIHGGLRYLKQLEFGLVKEVGSERAVVHALAPHLVVPEKMLLPLSEKRGMGYWLTSIGLKIYDWLAGVKPEDQRKMLTRAQTLKYEPLLRKDDVKGGAIYAEYRTDDARLTIEIAKMAFAYGADVINYLQVSDFTYADEKVSGVKVKDWISGHTFPISAKVVVSAAGPWVDELRTINRSREGKRLHLTKGVHIVIPHSKLPVRQAIYFDVEDGRMIFAIPRGRVTYVGTTDTNYEGDRNEVYATSEDVTYLVKAVNATFPTCGIVNSDIESSWAGLRPLIHEEGKSASELSRKDEIFESPSGLISIAGGKLTGYRKMAERVVDFVIERHFGSKVLKDCFTERIKVKGTFKNRADAVHYQKALIKKFSADGLDERTARYMVENYGSQTDEILKLREYGGVPELNLLLAEVKFTIQNEMVTSLQDFFVRRTGLAYFNVGLLKQYCGDVARAMQTQLHWSDARTSNELEALNTLIDRLSSFRK